MPVCGAFLANDVVLLVANYTGRLLLVDFLKVHSMRRVCRIVFFLLTLVFLAALGQCATAQTDGAKPTVFWPDNVEYDVDIETPEHFFGFDIGFRHLSHAQVAAYVRELARTSDRISIQSYGKTHGGRPLLLLTITSSENRQRLGKISSAHHKLTRADSSHVEIDNLPAVINMGYGVHGDEPSATNCAALVAYYLAAAQGEEIEKWLDDCVILLDPCLNPDGFNRFANWANRYRGRVPNPDPQHAEHNQMWPPGRVNYYWFDLNRDWLPLVHPESRGRMTWYHSWKPNVVLDFHEMGTQSTYFFQPGIPKRTNPLTPARNQKLTKAFARFHAAELDKRGRLFYTREQYDDFYMGKGSTYPDLHGSIGILFEQASSRGHVQKNQDGLLRFTDTIANQFTTSLTSLRATSAMREELLNYKRNFYNQAFQMAKKQEIKTYLFSSPHNRSRLIEFASVLRRHGISCFAFKQKHTEENETFLPSYTLVVPSQQSEFRFLQSLLMRRTQFEENIFYDVSSWTLPLAFDIKQTNLTTVIDKELLAPFSTDALKRKSTFSISPNDLGYSMDYRDDFSPKILARLLYSGVQVRVTSKPFELDLNQKKVAWNPRFPRGTLSIVLGTQPGKRDSIEKILQFADSYGVRIVPVRSGLSASGPDLGSSNFKVVERPKVALVIGPGTSPYSAGEIWHLLDSKIGMPVTLIKASQLDSVKLSDYSTLVLADGSLDDSRWSAADAFAQNGGTVIAVGKTAVALQKRIAEHDAAGNDTAIQIADADSEDEPSDSTKTKPLQQPFDSASTERALQLISGAIFKTKIDTTHPLLYGYSAPTLPVFRNHSKFLTPSTNPFCNPVIYDEKKPLLAGYCSPDNIEKFKGGASVVVHPQGKGRFILMADNPNFRGFWHGTSRIFLNAIFFGSQVDPSKR